MQQPRMYGPYRIVKEINRGGTAIVYEAIDTLRNARVACKVMTINSHTQAEVERVRAAVQREVLSASSLNHPHVVKLLDILQDNGCLVLVWELIAGQDLLDLLNSYRRFMPPPVVAFYFQQLVRAVMFMHEHGFCHRDLKAENCVVDLESEPHTLKVIDFGLSKHLDSAVTLGVGTPDYMPPELLLKASPSNALQARYDARGVDTWAMGVVLYLLCTGCYPFESEQHPKDLKGTLENIVRGNMRPMPVTVPQEVQELVASMLQQRPENRIQLAAILDNVWLKRSALSFAQRLYHKTGEYPINLVPRSWLPLPLQRLPAINQLQVASPQNGLGAPGPAAEADARRNFEPQRASRASGSNPPSSNGSSAMLECSSPPSAAPASQPAPQSFEGSTIAQPSAQQAYVRPPHQQQPAAPQPHQSPVTSWRSKDFEVMGKDSAEQQSCSMSPQMGSRSSGDCMHVSEMEHSSSAAHQPLQKQPQGGSSSCCAWDAKAKAACVPKTGGESKSRRFQFLDIFRRGL